MFLLIGPLQLQKWLPTAVMLAAKKGCSISTCGTNDQQYTDFQIYYQSILMMWVKEVVPSPLTDIGPINYRSVAKFVSWVASH